MPYPLRLGNGWLGPNDRITLTQPVIDGPNGMGEVA